MTPKRTVTIRDVAERANVAVSTASRALSGHPDVSEDARKRVMRASEELGYRPSLLAQSLVSGRTLTIGLLVSDISNPFYPELAKGVEDAASTLGYVVVLCNTEDEPARSLKYLERLIAQEADGIIHASVGLDEEHLALAQRAGIPLVFCNRRPRMLEGVDVVVADNERGAEELVTYLLSLGHRRIAYLAGPEFATVSDDRMAGYARALAKYGLPLDAQWVSRGPFTRESGGQRARELVARSPRPSAIFAVNDVVALGALDALLDLGVRVPQDISIVGFDNIELIHSHYIRLTSVAQNPYQMGRLATERLLDAMANPETHRPGTVVLETQLVIRRTSGPPPADTTAKNGAAHGD